MILKIQVVFPSSSIFYLCLFFVWDGSHHVAYAVQESSPKPFKCCDYRHLLPCFSMCFALEPLTGTHWAFCLKLAYWIYTFLFLFIIKIVLCSSYPPKSWACSTGIVLHLTPSCSCGISSRLSAPKACPSSRAVVFIGSFQHYIVKRYQWFHKLFLLQERMLVERMSWAVRDSKE